MYVSLSVSRVFVLTVRDGLHDRESPLQPGGFASSGLTQRSENAVAYPRIRGKESAMLCRRPLRFDSLKQSLKDRDRTQGNVSSRREIIATEYGYERLLFCNEQRQRKRRREGCAIEETRDFSPTEGHTEISLAISSRGITSRKNEHIIELCVCVLFHNV